MVNCGKGECEKKNCLSVQVWFGADAPNFRLLSRSHCHFSDTLVWLLCVVLNMCLVSFFFYYWKLHGFLNIHLRVFCLKSFHITQSLYVNITFLSSLSKTQIVDFFFRMKNTSHICCFRMIGFHRKFLFINFRVSQVEKTWGQCNLASVGIFGNCSENTFFVVVVLSAGRTSGCCKCGRKTKIWRYLYICMRR